VTRARLAGAGAAAAALACSGCFTISTTDVQVKDPKAVEVRTQEGESVLPSDGPPYEATLARGDYWDMLSRDRYEMRVSRGDRGDLTLFCDACDKNVEVLHDTGWTLPALSWNVDVEHDSVTADYAVCMRSGGKHCAITAEPRLFVPMSDVVEVRRRVEPVRIWGWALLVAGAAGFIATGLVLAQPGMGSFSDRAPWAAAVLVPTLTWTGIGLWEVLSPVREQVWRPDR
jgi:hypothetical protein